MSKLRSGKWKCKQCKASKEQTSAHILCDLCEQPVCLPCTPHDRTTYDFFQEKELPLPYLCEDCKSLIPELKDILLLKRQQEQTAAVVLKLQDEQGAQDTRITKCEQDFLALSERLDQLEAANTERETQRLLQEERLTSLTNRTGSLETANNEREAQRLQHEQDFPPPHVGAYGPRSTPQIANLVRSEMSERELILKLRDNLVITGIEEKGSDLADAEEVAAVIENELGIRIRISGTERIGVAPVTPEGQNQDQNTGRRPRLLRVKFASKENRRETLVNAIKLRQSETPHVKDNVFIRPDLTKTQRDEQKNLRTLLRRKRRENPEKTYKIHRNEVIETTPPTGPPAAVTPTQD